MVTALGLAKLFDGFLLSREAAGVRETTLQMYRVMYGSLVEVLPLEKLEDPSTIERRDLDRWAVWLKSNYAPATCDQRIAKAKTFFRWCHTEGFLSTNPVGHLQRPKKTWQPDPLSSEEVAMLLQAAKRGRGGVRNFAIVCVLLDSGIRNGELRALKPEDVSIRTGQIKIREGKGGKPRTVIIGSHAKEALWRWLMVRPESAGHLFCTEQGKQLSNLRLHRITGAIGDRIGIRCYPHRLRHTFALQYLKLGGDPYSLQYLLGHEDMTVTREYVKIVAKDASDMYRSPLDALLV